MSDVERESNGQPAGGGSATGRPGHVALAGLVFAVTLALLMATDSQYGITYDEPIYQSKSLQALEWLKLFTESPGLAASEAYITRYWQATDKHPGFFKLVTGISAATFWRVLPQDAVMRSGTNVLSALCFASLYLLVASVWGRAAGMYAVGALLLMPRVFAHCHLAALDAPIMAMTLLTLAASWRVCPGGAGGSGWAPWRWAAVAGILWGLALSTKLNAFFIPIIVLPWAVVFARRHVVKLCIAFGILGPMAFLASWPWLWHNTWPRFVEYFGFHFRHGEIGVTYLGQVHNLAPWHYPLVMTAITLPVATLLMAGVGVSRSGGM